ncbi:hypothetical protein CBW58_02100 [Yersinia frederiksenii]|nr:hypothetical protein CBW58_02100 [Yersinia frederiksenii]
MITHLPSKERLEAIAYGSVRQSQEEGVFMARALLAAYEQEPVYQLWNKGIGEWVECEKKRYDNHEYFPAQRRILYAHPALIPAAVPDSIAMQNVKDIAHCLSDIRRFLESKFMIV